jgi:predicted RNase H-like nuclease/predicted enzyme related to lactoylglutathione lyase
LALANAVTESRLAFVALSVADVDRATRFYREAFGVDLGAHGEATVGFELVRGAGAAHVGFAVDDLDRAHAQAVRAGAAVVHEPRAEPWGRAATYLDLDGNVVSLTERAHAVRVAGVDIAGGAWAVVVLEGSRVVDAFRCESFADALLVDAEVIGVDIPIGFPDGEARPADLAARRFIGPRASSVFPMAPRAVLEQPSYADARRVAVELTGKSVSAQAYAIGRRIVEVDDYAHTDARVIEVHPEASFRELARRPLRSKHTSDGLAERRRLLVEDAGIEVPATAPRIAEPDLLDATIVAWSAARYARGQALALPDGHAERIGAIWR